MATSKGITLLELTMAMAMVLLILGVIFAGFQIGLRLLPRETTRSELTLECERAVERMTSELREARALLGVSSSEVTFWWKDLNGNGSQEASEVLTYTLSGEALLRIQAGESISLANFVKTFTLQFEPASRTIALNLKVEKGEEAYRLQSKSYGRNL